MELASQKVMDIASDITAQLHKDRCFNPTAESQQYEKETQRAGTS
jgi:hypothetical protein